METYGGVKSTYLRLNLEVSLLRKEERVLPIAEVSCDWLGIPPGPLYVPGPPTCLLSLIGPPWNVLLLEVPLGKRGLLVVTGDTGRPEALFAGAVLQYTKQDMVYRHCHRAMYIDHHRMVHCIAQMYINGYRLVYHRNQIYMAGHRMVLPIVRDPLDIQ